MRRDDVFCIYVAKCTIHSGIVPIPIVRDVAELTLSIIPVCLGTVELEIPWKPPVTKTLLLDISTWYLCLHLIQSWQNTQQYCLDICLDRLSHVYRYHRFRAQWRWGVRSQEKDGVGHFNFLPFAVSCIQAHPLLVLISNIPWNKYTC